MKRSKRISKTCMILAVLTGTALFVGCAGAAGTPQASSQEIAVTKDLTSNPLPDNGGNGELGGYEYAITNSYDSAVKERGYSIDTENRPDAPIYYFIYSGEHSTGGYGIYVRNLAVDSAGNLTITVEETSPGPDETVTEAFTYPTCRVSIYPHPGSVSIVNTKGVAFDYLPDPARVNAE